MPTPFNFTSRLTKYQYDQANDLSPVKRIEATFDSVAALAQNGTAILANDVFQLISVPANTFVFNVRAEVLTQEGAASTFDVGDGATADGYLGGANGNAATNAQSFTADIVKAFGSGKLYTSADTIDLKVMTGAWLKLKVKLTATMITM